MRTEKENYILSHINKNDIIRKNGNNYCCQECGKNVLHVHYLWEYLLLSIYEKQCRIFTKK